jgi:hypothetical protein
MRQKYLYLLFLELILLFKRELNIIKTLYFFIKRFIIIAENSLLSVFNSKFNSLSSSFFKSYI